MIYKMPYPVWSKIANSFPLIDGGYIDEESVIRYLKSDCGLVDTGEWSHPSMEDDFDDWEDEEELYHYRVVNKKKYAVFLLKWG